MINRFSKAWLYVYRYSPHIWSSVIWFFCLEKLQKVEGNKKRGGEEGGYVEKVYAVIKWSLPLMAIENFTSFFFFHSDPISVLYLIIYKILIRLCM